MGVNGLQRYISDRKDLFLKQFLLCNSYIVVDGNCICCFLYNFIKSDSAFGGDYDEYYNFTKKFFQNLQKCNVVSVVIFDGGHEKKKVKKVLQRIRSKLVSLESFNNGYSTTKFFPIFLRKVFLDVLNELNVIYFQSESEADPEIASLARVLNCPVLSYDSDFYIYDVLYIPFSSVNITPIRVNDENFKGFAMSCLLYDTKYFFETFSGLDKSMMPIAATLLGNDFNETCDFENFFTHVIIPLHGLSYNQRKIHGVFHWLKKENFDSAVQHIVEHLGKKMSKKFIRALKKNVKHYKSFSIASFVLTEVQKQIKINSENISKIKEEKTKMNVPSFFRELIHKGRIEPFMLDMIHLGTYFTINQVENFKMKSSHFWSLKLIAALYTIIKMFCVDQSKSLAVYMINSRHYNKTFLNDLPNLNNFNLKKMILQSRQERLELIYGIIDFCESDIEVVSKFSDDWLLIMASFIYWLKKLGSDINSFHAKAIILGAVCNQIVQKPVGYYRTMSSFIKDKCEMMKQLKTTNLKLENNCKNFCDLVRNVTMYECLLIQKKLIPMRQTSRYNIKNNVLDINAIHFFNIFQSCLFHIAQLNVLLNNPLFNMKISDFYSGTLIYNFYVDLQQKKGTANFEEVFFKESPNILRCIAFIEDSLRSHVVNFQNNHNKKRKRKRRKSPLILGEDDTCSKESLKFYDSAENDSGNEECNTKFSDKSNHYFILSK